LVHEIPPLIETFEGNWQLADVAMIPGIFDCKQVSFSGTAEEVIDGNNTKFITNNLRDKCNVLTIKIVN
jgi:hypothetical protein